MKQQNWAEIETALEQLEAVVAQQDDEWCRLRAELRDAGDVHFQIASLPEFLPQDDVVIPRGTRA